jgi:hypothetical protein
MASEAVSIKENEIVENVPSEETNECTVAEKGVPVVSNLLLKTCLFARERKELHTTRNYV